MDKHKVFQKELGKRAGCMKMLKRSVRELTRSSSSSSSSSGGGCSGGCGSGVDAQRLQLQMEELSARWEAVCGMSVCKQGRLEAAMRQAEEFHALVHSFLGRLSEAEKTLKYGLGPPEERSAQQCQLQLQLWVEAAEEALSERDGEPLPDGVQLLRELSRQHAEFMEEL
uniref:Epiplakin 1 n=1 Tax=Gallus gallus TaxID=9031 RepID=A0A8V0Y6W3_CHICK